MAETSHLFESARAGLSSLRDLQTIYDADMWDIDDPAFANVRHIHLHLSITIGKIAKLIEPRDHRAYHGELVDLSECADELRPILADLLIHAAQIANLVNGDLGEMLEDRYHQNAARFAPDSVFARSKPSAQSRREAAGA